MPEDTISYPENPFEAFSMVVDECKKEKSKRKAAIFTHNFPDPDAIGSMMAVSWLLEKVFGVKSVLYYDGEVSHPQNNSIVNLLEPPLVSVVNYAGEEHCLHILVDTVPKNAGLGKNDIKFDIVIDHHKTVLGADFNGLYINLKAGSASATIFQIIKHCCEKLSVWFAADNDMDRKVATAILVGIVTDTEFMMSDDTTLYEFKAFSELFEFRIPSWLKEIVFFKRPKFWVDAKAVASKKVTPDEEGYAIVGMGAIPEKQRDLLADMADEMQKWASVETAVAFGVVNGNRIEGCVRSNNSSLSVPELCRKLGGNGNGSGGGKHGKGAYRYDLGNFSICEEDDDNLIDETLALIEKKEIARIKRMVK